jgi:hypothetical protein
LFRGRNCLKEHCKIHLEGDIYRTPLLSALPSKKNNIAHPMSCLSFLPLNCF